MKTHFGVIVLLIGSLYPITSEAVKCYNYLSDSQKAKCDGEICVKTTATVSGITAASGSCVISKDFGCTESTIVGIKTTTCYCDTDLCNGDELGHPEPTDPCNGAEEVGRRPGILLGLLLSALMSLLIAQ
ncbi:hypothetical protein CAPTEDRAFT_218141 [Capitella teleta]|uniref:UPAR/Ly6 domain-containing protein n=1 Tax=Capitella teleta TaxID=283909 RepID=R7THV8_CAPTE|nr:hypothetical protein CAPTEDRAFT_218141 [Capitella teleta]|eukprot:ELT93067.1 hypothetical protein CAPTEDRAFT_218141 [Capitella teleta]